VEQHLFTGMVIAHKHGNATECTNSLDTSKHSIARLRRAYTGRRWNDEQRVHKCKQCTYAVVAKRYLAVHEYRVHSGERGKHVCAICGKSCWTPSALTLHTLSHTNERPYACTKCNATFKTAGRLGVHQRIHDVTSPYRWNECADGSELEPTPKPVNENGGLKIFTTQH
jgi:KRAB domain-containing zinc finger protein